MIGTIRKHQTWLWAIIITLTVASFVVFGPTNSRMGDLLGNGSRSGYGKIDGKAITREDEMNAMREVQLANFLQTGQWLDSNNSEASQRTYYRLFIIQKEKELGIQVSSKAIAELAQTVLGKDSLDDFVNQILKPTGMDASDFERYLRHELGLRQLVMAAGVNGRLVTPQEAETMYKLEHQDLESYLAYFSASNYLNEVKVTPEIIHQFYTNQIANYQVPDEVRVDYVKYNVTNYFKATLAALTNMDQIVDMYVQQRLGTNLFHGTKTPAESRAAIRDLVIREQSLKSAQHDASTFAMTLDQMEPRTNNNLALLASSNGLAAASSALFDREYGPQDLTVPTDFARKAFGLSFEDPFGGPIVAQDGVYVIALKQRIPSEIPPLERIEAKVTADFRFASAVQIAQQAALKFHAALTNGLAQGKSFAAICAQNGVKYEALPPFNLNTKTLPPELEDRIEVSLLKQAAFGTEPGKSSPVAGTRDGAFMLYVEKKLPLDEAVVKSELPGFTAYLRSVRQNDAFQQWFRMQIQQDPDFVQILQRLAQEAPGKSPAARKPSS